MLRRASRWLALAVGVLATAAGSFAGTAGAQIPNISANISGPTPNPVPAGASTAVSAQFTINGDVDFPITVSIELQGAGTLGTLTLDEPNTSPELSNCQETASAVTCEWQGDATDAPQGAIDASRDVAVNVAVDEATPPQSSWNLAAIVDSADTEPQNLNNAQLFVSPPSGNTTLSGMVLTENEVPVEGACVFILARPNFVFQAITDALGQWSLEGLPDTYLFAIGNIAPYEGEFGPCADNGPPPVPEPGDLQPVFFDDIWFDLSDPKLVGGNGDPYTYAVKHGATSISRSTSGLDACLTTAPGDVVPRPSCLVAVPTTTTTTPPPTTTTTIDPGTTTTLAATTTTAVGGVTSLPRPPTTMLLPVTGSSSGGIGLFAVGLLGLGAVAVAITRRPRRT